MNAVKWAFKETASLIGHAIGHAIGPAIFFFLYALVKAFKDNTTIFYFWEHPLELISPALFTILATACVALVRVVIKQHRKLKSFGVRLFSKHDTASVKKSDWAALCLDIELASKERSPLWILGATGKETFSGATAPLFDVLRSYGGDIKILLVRPDSFAFTHRCKGLGLATDNYCEEIVDSIEYCKDLIVKKERSVELKLYETLPIWKMFLTNRVLWVQYYKPGEHVDNTPIYCFEYGGPESTLFDGFRTVFQKRWTHDGSKTVNLASFVRSAWKTHC